MATIIEKDGGGSGGGTAFMSFILGGVVLAAAVIGFFMWDSYKAGGGPAPAKTNITITAPKTPGK